MNEQNNDKTLLRYPNLRDELLTTLRHLADIDYQWRVWIKGEFDSKTYYDSLSDSLGFLYDDIAIPDNPSGAISVYLRNSEEVNRVMNVIEAIDKVINEVGNDADDVAYISCPLWKNVIQAASKAVAELAESNG